MATKSALHFVDENSRDIILDQDEWKWAERGDPVLHIELRDWADVFLIAPLSANSMAKLANGICDNLLTCIARAWGFEAGGKPILVCPAMNPTMWHHPVTLTQLHILKEYGYHIIDPIEKKVICGDVGLGAMAEPATIVKALADLLDSINSESSG